MNTVLSDGYPYAPVMDGFGRRKEIRSLNLEMRNHVSIIAMTTRCFEKDFQKCLAAGMDGHITSRWKIRKAVSDISEIKTDETEI